MNAPHRCPVCKGKGEIGRKKAKHDAVPFKTIATKKGKPRQIFKCHVCAGNGVLWDLNITIYPTTINDMGAGCACSPKGESHSDDCKGCQF
jgi:DnaJ-class molecular chaperone